MAGLWLSGQMTLKPMSTLSASIIRARQGNEFQVNTWQSDTQSEPSVSALGDGFVVTGGIVMAMTAGGSSHDVFAKIFTTTDNNTAVDTPVVAVDEFLVNDSYDPRQHWFL